MYECYNCGEYAVICESTSTKKDKIIHICKCENCGAEIKYTVPIKKEKEVEEE